MYTSAMLEDVKEWLLDENVPTEWDVLLAIRQRRRAEAEPRCACARADSTTGYWHRGYGLSLIHI